MFLLIKTLISALVLVGVSELGKKNALLGGIFGALPIISILVFSWLYYETRDTARVAALCTEIGIFVLPTLVFFFLYPVLLKKGFGFFPGMVLALIPMAAAYWATLKLFR